MRVTGGELRGRPLHSGGNSRDMRPTQDRVREALFSILGGRMTEACVADLFAGTGSLGIEALSRGAARADFVESDGDMVAVLRRNLTELGLLERARVVRAPVERFLSRSAPGSYDLLLADPPYQRGWTERLVELVASGDWLAEDGLLVVERSAREEETDPGPALERRTARTYGETRLEIYARRGVPNEGG